MRTYEQNMAEAKKAFQQISNNVRESTPNSVPNPAQRAALESMRQRLGSMHNDAASTSSAGDVASETSSDMPQPSVDTQKLDKQIKAVMIDLIPFLNENIDKTCDQAFLEKVSGIILDIVKNY